MKKMLSLLLALALVFSLAACGSTGEATPAEPTAARPRMRPRRSRACSARSR